ncbi:MAG: tripartite tricarboxylate transporter TctB family protein [Nakamurella sp.]
MTTSKPEQNPAAPPTEPAGAAPVAAGPSAHGLSELVVPGILVAVAIFLIIGTMNMAVPPSVQVPGPTFFPILIICLLLLMAVLSTIQILRGQAEHRRLATSLAGDQAQQEGRSSGFDDVDADGDLIRSGSAGHLDLDGDQVDELPPDVPPGRQPWPRNAFSDWRALGTVLVSLVLFIALLRPAGWIIAAALLFWGVSYALGARRPIFDASVALVMSSLIQLIFGAGLGLNLPAGFLEGVF